MKIAAKSAPVAKPPKEYKYIEVNKITGQVIFTEPVDWFNIRGVIKSLKELADDNNM